MATETPGLSLRHGVRCVPAEGVTVEDVLLGMGEIVGHGNIVSASRMNKAVVVFLKESLQADQLVENGVWVSGVFVSVTPLVSPTTRVTISNVPPFISNEDIQRELSRFGKFASGIKTISLGCKNDALKHVLSFRRQVFMFLSAPTLNVSFRCMYAGKSYMLYASTGEMRCFECGNIGHVKANCTIRSGGQLEVSSDVIVASVGSEGGNVAEQAFSQDNLSREVPSVSNVNVEDVADINVTVASSNTGSAGGSDDNVINENDSLEEEPGSAHLGKVAIFTESEERREETGSGDSDEAADGGDESAQGGDGDGAPGYEEESGGKADSECSGEEIEDEDDCGSEADVAEVLQMNCEQIYSLGEINKFLDDTYGKHVQDIADFFPDIIKFEKSITYWKKKAGTHELNKRKRFRLTKLVTRIRKERAAGKATQ